MSVAHVHNLGLLLESRHKELWQAYVDALSDDWLSTPAKAFAVALDVRSVAKTLADNLLSLAAIRQRLDECKPLHTFEEEN